MVDTVTPQRRSEIMSKIRSRNTTPELRVRRLLREMRVGYRLHVKGLPGSPDIVMKGRKQLIIVHGCFWHQHESCKIAHIPKSRKEFWEAKLSRNVTRDKKNEALLRELGWDIITIWECETAQLDNLRVKLREALRPFQKSRG
ncbi:MAG: DNA mismatch endonuclease Vsr [Chloroflexi bacterium]|nr:DNA mismatch endonuclease Vsr [Chloroflexota bacterium]